MAIDLEEQYDRLYRYCYFKLHSREQAEDLTQEAFLRWLEHGGAAQDPVTAQKYLYTVARNLCIDLFRRPQAEPLAPEDAETAGTTSGPEEAWAEQLAVRAALTRLSPEEQELLLLRYVNELPVAALAGVYGLSRFAVRRRLLAAAARLRTELQKEELG